MGDRARAHPGRARHPPRSHLGYRISEGDTSLCYIPDQELGLGPPLRTRGRRSLPGFDLASGVSHLVHDCQYTDDEYPSHVGWGHSRLSDVLTFAQLTEAQRLALFHHDPLHDDEQLDRLHADARERWEGMGRSSHEVTLAAELQELELARPTRIASRIGSCAL